MKSLGRIHVLEAITPLDGRYRERLEDCAQYFSEYSIIRRRLMAEVAYLEFLVDSDGKLADRLPYGWRASLRSVASDFSMADAEQVKTLERRLGHDVVAVIEYLNIKLDEKNLPQLKPYVHLGLTSEDINNIAYTTLFRDFTKEIYLRDLSELIEKLLDVAAGSRDTPMMARTHGQPAVPTTFGKFLANYAYRVSRLAVKLAQVEWCGKLGGAVGDLGSLILACREIDWMEFQRRMLERMGLTHFPASTQILPHECLAEPFSKIALISAILSNMARDLWLLGMLGLVRFEREAGSFHSSAMPQKSNPIHLENAEGALDLAAEMLTYLSRRLIASRLHRDLSDSILRRFYSFALATAVLGLRSLKKSMDMMVVERDKMLDELRSHPEVWAEKIQVLLRRHNVTEGYELAREFSTRGREWLAKRLEDLGLEKDVRESILDNSLEEYLNGARKFTDELLAETRSNLRMLGG